MKKGIYKKTVGCLLPRRVLRESFYKKTVGCLPPRRVLRERFYKKTVGCLIFLLFIVIGVKAQEYYDWKFTDSTRVFYGMTIFPTRFMDSDKYFLIKCNNTKIVVDRLNVFGDLEEERVAYFSCADISQAVVYSQDEVLFFVRNTSSHLIMYRFNITSYLSGQVGISQIGTITGVAETIMGTPAISNLMYYPDSYKSGVITIGNYTIGVAYQAVAGGYYVAWNFYDPQTHTFDISKKQTFRWDSGLSSINKFYLKASQGHCFYWATPGDLCSFQIIFEGKSNQNSNYNGIYVREAHLGTWGWEFVDKGLIGFDTSYGFWFQTPGIDTWTYSHPWREGYSPYLERTIFFRQRSGDNRVVGADLADYRWNFIGEYMINEEGTNAFMPKAFKICENIEYPPTYTFTNLTFPNQTFIYFSINAQDMGNLPQSAAFNITITDYYNASNSVSYRYTVVTSAERFTSLRAPLPASTVNITVSFEYDFRCIEMSVDILPGGTPFYVTEGAKEGTLAFAFPIMYPYFGDVTYGTRYVNTGPYAVQTARVVAPAGVAYGNVTVFVYDLTTGNCTYFSQGNEVVLTNVETGAEYRYGITDNATYWVDNVCMVSLPYPPYQEYYGAYGYNFSNIPTGTYRISVTRSGYSTESYTYGEIFTLDANENKYISANLRLKSVYDITINVQNVYTGESLSFGATLYYSNGTVYPGTSGTYYGKVIYKYIPNGTYYFTVTSDGYYKYTSPKFYLDTDRTFNVRLSPTTEKIILSGPSQVYISDDVMISIYSEGVRLPRSVILMVNNKYWRDSIGGPLQCISFALYNETQNFTIEAKWDCLKEGMNDVYLDAESFESTHLAINVLAIRPGYNISQVIPVPPEYSPVVSFFLTPLFLSSLAVIGLAGYVEYKVKSNGVAFLIICLIGIVLLGFFGVYPIWVTVLLFILAAAIGAYFIRKQYGGG